ncbi:hypothetical protein BGZ46_006047 [Entomortierella lignicola]|nr:hypothetical protein BGZ46_006047 [Entomortierella lignicola]
MSEKKSRPLKQKTPKIHKSTEQNTSEFDQSDTPNQENDTGAKCKSKKKRSRGDTIENDMALLNRLRGNVPLDMMETTLKNMHSKAYQVDGFPMVLPLETAAYLRSVVGKGYSISKIDTTNAGKAVEQEFVEDKLLEAHEELSPQHLSALESHGLEGLEVPMGAVLTSGKK